MVILLFLGIWAWRSGDGRQRQEKEVPFLLNTIHYEDRDE
jgi:hypothetical protein